MRQAVYLCLQDWRMANRGHLFTLLPFNTLQSTQELYFEKCILKTVGDSDWSLICDHMTGLTRLHLDIGPVLPEAISTITSLQILTIEHDHDHCQAEWLTCMTNLTRLVVGGRERILRGVRSAAL